MKTLTRYIPSNYTEIASNDYATVYGAEITNRDRVGYVAIGFIGRQGKHAFHYGYPTEADREAQVTTFLTRLANAKESRATRIAERKVQLAADIAAVRVGDMFSCSWGYDQTNVDFYQVVEKKAKSFVIREIAGRAYDEAPSGSMSDYRSPVPGAFLSNSEPIVKTSFSMKHGCLSKTTVDEKHFTSWYA